MRCFSHMHRTTGTVCGQAVPLTVLGVPREGTVCKFGVLNSPNTVPLLRPPSNEEFSTLFTWVQSSIQTHPDPQTHPSLEQNGKPRMGTMK